MCKAYLEEVSVAVEDGGNRSVAQEDPCLHSKILELDLHSGGRNVCPAQDKKTLLQPFLGFVTQKDQASSVAQQYET